ncbi:OsmC family protein [Sphingomonas pokkalii]|uniref:Osmotically inducible protein C n=1 Tax=Sphingomonas pokkalii TaxID=2175090 RepID=A0A2U0SG79_9SPHN|nr:OsmC family protein [Sphingomonas pokkalii]PVX30372.1 osmotically inducible protein C [Sphingomonas pokkalii]
MAHALAHIGPDLLETRIEAGRHPLLADEPESRGGSDAGPAPYDLLLAALGACTAMTLRMYADRKGWRIEALDVDLRLVSGTEGPRIRRILSITGPDAAGQARLAEIAERTPVTLTLKQGIAIDTQLAAEQAA